MYVPKSCVTSLTWTFSGKENRLFPFISSKSHFFHEESWPLFYWSRPLLHVPLFNGHVPFYTCPFLMVTSLLHVSPFPKIAKIKKKSL